ncbi:uncharacterized protein LOC122504333 isoform X2 [Leptopilina heterotoma]|uniref:uncharacterized protein LOC122504333 isoform X2 n=1 Tax=Leptopilina heterotoma TaxID=63436 RepID=UPI001CA850F6|nr:uncharacterized protein LOC122504333 isoform X2 [Leptopilina heterotoma]
MFFYLIAIAAALFTIFGLSSSRNSLRNFSSRRLNHIIQEIFGIFSSRDEYVDHHRILDEIGRADEELLKTDGVIVERRTEICQNMENSSEEKPAIQTESNESFTFDYRRRRHDSSRVAEERSSSFERERNNVLVPQDMWNILKKTAVPASERKKAESLFEALLQETLRESQKLRDDNVENGTFSNKTQIIGEATFEKMMEEQAQNEGRKDHLQME